MTRGHIHAKIDRPEIYYCQAGSGVMLMETPPGETRVVAMKPQTVVYVPPYWIHRSVNTGSDVLLTQYCYPADQGRITNHRSRKRHEDFDCGQHAGGWREKANPRYRPQLENPEPPRRNLSSRTHRVRPGKELEVKLNYKQRPT